MEARIILLVDDEDSIRSFLPPVLESPGVRVATAASLAEALEALGRSPVDLVITDLRLLGPADRSGLEIVVRAKKLQPSARVVVLTAFSTREIETEARRLGADGFWSKEISIPELVEKVRAMGISAGRE